MSTNWKPASRAIQPASRAFERRAELLALAVVASGVALLAWTWASVLP